MPLPGGTFTLVASQVNSTGTVAPTISGSALDGSVTIAGALSIPGDLYYLNMGYSFNNTIAVRSVTSSNQYVLTGANGGTYLFSGLPSGFIVATARLNFGGTTGFFGVVSDVNTNLNATCKIQFDANTFVQVVQHGGQGVLLPTTPFIHPRYPGGSSLDLDSGGYGCLVSDIVGSAAPVFILDQLTISGTYNILSSSISLPLSQNFVKAGDPIIVIDPNGSLNTIKSIVLTYNDPVTLLTSVVIPATAFVSQSSTSLTFIIPINFPFAGLVTVSGLGNGTQFSGYVMLGVLNVYIFNGSGIYVLVPGKSTDTLYGQNGIRFATVTNLIDIFDYDEETTEQAIINRNLLSQLIMNPLDEEEIINDSSNIIDDGVSNNLYLISNNLVAVTTDWNIPNPFIKTGFLP